MKTDRFLSAAILGFALAFTISCSSGGGGDGSAELSSSSSSLRQKSSNSDAKSSSSELSSSSVAVSSSSPKPSSSSVPPSSSSVVKSSSSVPTQSEIIYGPSVTYQGETYKTVVIGTQTWFQRNLNYAFESNNYAINSRSKCGVEGAWQLSDANTTTCNTYGRLYNWPTAMAMEEVECNIATCHGQIKSHQGICPDGWHIPSDADWEELIDYVESENGCSDCAAKYLKAPLLA